MAQKKTTAKKQPTPKPTKEEKGDIERDDDFTTTLLDQAMKVDIESGMVAGIKLRPPTLGTIAILNRCRNALVTGAEVSEDDIILHCLVFLYVHSADIDEVHGAALMSIDGRNITIERKAFELGDTLPFTGIHNFVEVYQGLADWINKHVSSKIEPIPDNDGGKEKQPPPNE